MKITLKNGVAASAVGALVTVLTISSCNNSPYPGYTMNESGVYSKFYKHDEKGAKPKEGDMVKLIMSYKNSKDSVLFDSKMKNPSGKNYIEFPLSKSTFKGSFEDALMSMSVGDSASFMIAGDSVYLKTFRAKELPKYILPGSMLTFEAKLEKITPKEEVEAERKKKMEEKNAMLELRKNEEPKALAKYLEDNKITTKPTASGLILIEKTKGKGAKPAKGDKVKVNYTGRLLDGTVFDTSVKEIAQKAGPGVYNEQRPYEPIEIPIGVGQVIPGWDEAIMMMNKGEKAQLIIPSSIAYGEQGQGPITPFSTLVFDVELVSFSPAEAAPKGK